MTYGYWFDDQTYQQMSRIAEFDQIFHNDSTMSDLLSKGTMTFFKIQDDHVAELQAIQWYALEEHS